METYIGYLNNFPREGALKGDLFEGSESLKQELSKRGIVGKVKKEGKTIVVDSKKLLTEKDEVIKSLESDMKQKDETIEELKALVLETSLLTKDKLPEGFEKYQGEK